MRTFVVTILLMLIPAFANAQVGKDSALWQWSADGQHHNAVVEVSLNGATGTGVIVHVNRDKPVGKGFQGYCLTAHHVVEKDESKREIQLKYHTGRIASRCKIVAFDKEHDLAILWVWVPNDIKPVAIAKQNIQASQRLEYAGLGGGSKIENGLRHFYGNSSAPTSSKKIFADVSLLPGDSGGPVFNENKEVVGVISGGWFWFDGGVTTDAGTPFHTTWPARSCNVEAIRLLARKVPELKTEPEAMLVKNVSPSLKRRQVTVKPNPAPERRRVVVGSPP